MKRVLIIGATGSVGRVVRKTILEKTDWKVTLFSRSADKLTIDDMRESTIVGDVFDKEKIEYAVTGQDAVFVALTGRLDAMAKQIVDAMEKSGVKQLVFISSMGIYNEIPVHLGSGGNLSTNPILFSYRKAADVIECSNLNYTVIRPGWFDNGSNDYTISKKGQYFEGNNVSRQAIANFVVLVIDNPELYPKESVGIHRPE